MEFLLYQGYTSNDTTVNTNKLSKKNKVHSEFIRNYLREGFLEEVTY